MNKENFKKVLDKIKKDPESWDQTVYHCDTAHCFAGHCQIEMGVDTIDVHARRDARIFLNISLRDSIYLFNGSRTIKDFEEVLIGTQYDKNGYDKDGYNVHGFMEHGYYMFRDMPYQRDLTGYDSDGLDKNNKPKPPDKTS